MEKRNGDFVRGLIGSGSVSAAHDLSDGGLLMALAEMAMASGIGAMLDPEKGNLPCHAFWFGEDQARYLLTVPAAQAQHVLNAATSTGVPACRLGVTGGDALVMPGVRPVTVVKLRDVFEGWLPAYMAGVA